MLKLMKKLLWKPRAGVEFGRSEWKTIRCRDVEDEESLKVVSFCFVLFCFVLFWFLLRFSLPLA